MRSGGADVIDLAGADTGGARGNNCHTLEFLTSGAASGRSLRLKLESKEMENPTEDQIRIPRARALGASRKAARQR